MANNERLKSDRHTPRHLRSRTAVRARLHHDATVTSSREDIRETVTKPRKFHPEKRLQLNRVESTWTEATLQATTASGGREGGSLFGLLFFGSELLLLLFSDA